MKAYICSKYGPPDVLQLAEVEKPAPGDNEVLIRIRATTVTAGDVKIRSSDFPPPFQLLARLMFGFRKPRKPVLGMEFAGAIEAVGKDVKRFKTGDQVYGSGGFGFGCYTEYKCMAEDSSVALKPANLTFEEAAAVPIGATTALFFLKEKGKIRSGQQVLIYGASGSVGTYAVQLARHFGADVTGVCSTTNLEMVNSLGAETVIDYTKEDFTENGQTYDIIFHTVGECPRSRCKRSLKEKGSYVSALSTQSAPDRSEDLVVLKSLIEAGKIKPVIDRSYPFEQIPEAHRYVEQGHKKGNVVVSMPGIAET